jgi:hypothetical protein
MKKSGLINHDTQRNMPEFSKLLSKAIKNNPSGGLDLRSEKGQSNFRGTPDQSLINENDNDFNKSLNYRPKADTDEGSNKYEHLNGKFGKTNIKNTGMKSINSNSLNEGPEME